LKLDALKLLDGPIAVDVEESVRVLQTEDDPTYQFIEGMSGRAVFTRMFDGKVLVRGRLASRVQAQCVRCLAPVELSLAAEVMLVYVNDSDLLDPAKRLEFPEEIVYYNGHVIEPLDDLRELLLLELPAYPVCELSPGQVCGHPELKSGPAVFGADESGSSSVPSAGESGRPEEPEWKAALRRMSAQRTPKTP
jgi:uncharacterized metal-binding protein YceD (DUF177 family)